MSRDLTNKTLWGSTIVVFSLQIAPIPVATGFQVLASDAFGAALTVPGLRAHHTLPLPAFFRINSVVFHCPVTAWACLGLQTSKLPTDKRGVSALSIHPRDSPGTTFALLLITLNVCYVSPKKNATGQGKACVNSMFRNPMVIKNKIRHNLPKW